MGNETRCQTPSFGTLTAVVEVQRLFVDCGPKSTNRIASAADVVAGFIMSTSTAVTPMSA